MINQTASALIEVAERRLDEAQYPPGGFEKARIWHPSFIIAITYALIAIAKGIEEINNGTR